MKIVKILFFVNLFLISLTSLAMEDYLNNLQDLNRRLGDLQRNFGRMGVPPETIFPGTRPYPSNTNPTSSQQSRDAYSHCQFITVPHALKGLMHVQCDCQDLANNGHYCGSHALTHAIEIEQTYGARANDEKASDIVKTSFKKRNFISYESKILGRNTDIVATDNNLNHICLGLNNLNQPIATFRDSSETPEVIAFKKLLEKRLELISSGDDTKIIHVFFRHQVKDEVSGNIEWHVAVFSIIRHQKELVITLHDNLNKPIKENTPLYFMSKTLLDFFIKCDYKALAKKNAQEILKITDNDLASGYTSWLAYAKNECKNQKILTIAPLNKAIKPLKAYLTVHSDIKMQDLLVATYRAMVTVIEESNSAENNHKLDQIMGIESAIKNSIKQKFFSSNDESVHELREKIQSVKISLKK